MRTTVILPDELYRQAKAASQAAGRTFTSFLEEAIRRELAREDSDLGPVDIHLAPPFSPPPGLEGTMPGVDLMDKAQIQSILDEDDFAVQQIRQVGRRSDG